MTRVEYRGVESTIHVVRQWTGGMCVQLFFFCFVSALVLANCFQRD